MAFTPNVQGSRVIGSLSGITSISSVILSASTYIGLPTDIRVTGGTYSSGIATFRNNTGGTFTVTGFSTGTSSTDTYVTGGTYSNGTATFTNNSGGTFTVSGFKTNDIFVTGSTYSNNEFIFTNNTGGTFNVLFNTVTGLTSTGLINASTISATTYQNLPIDINVTGGTYSNGDILFTNNTGGTFTVSGLYTGYTTPIDVRVTGGTYSNGTAVFTNNTGGTFNVTGFKNDDTFVTGGTYSNGDILFTNNTGGTFNVSGLYTGYTAPIDVFTTGGTYNDSTGVATFTNNSGGTFNVNGFFKTSDDIYTTGMTFNPSTYDLSIGRNDNTSFTQNLAILASDMTITGGTYNVNTGVATFTNNTGGTFSVSGFLTGMTDTYTTGFTYSDNTLTLKRNASQPDLSVLIDTMTGLTVNGIISATTISATTFYGNGSNLTGLVTQDTFVTGATYSNNAFTYRNNTGGTFDVLFNTVTGLTINGDLNVTGLTTTKGVTSTGGITFKQVTINSSYTASTSDYMIDVSGGTFTVSLPSAVGIQGRLLVIKNNGGGAVTVDPYGSETIDGKPFVILGETNVVQLASNGTEWIALSYNISTVNSSTGVFEFTGLTKLTSSTFRVAPVKGWIVDDTTNPLSPQLYYVDYSGGTHTATYLNTATETWVYLTSGGTISQSNINLTDQQRRENIFLGKLGHADKTSIINAFSQPDFVLSPLSQLRDMFDPIGFINEGIRPSANGANLSFNTSAGYLHGLGINFVNNILNPNAIYVSGNSPCTFQYRTQTGGTASNVTVIDPTKYDVGGVVTSLSGTKATNQRIYLVQNGLFRVQYGQTEYTSLVKAIEGLSSEPFVEFSNFQTNGILVGVLSVLSSATDLSDTSKAQFFNVSKFGDSAGAAGGAATTTLQQAYNNSTTPEIVINATLDGLTIKNGTGNADNITRLLEGQTGANGVTSFIRADGYISGTTFQSNGFIANSGGLTATTISATTYYNLPTDIRVTGSTYSNNTFTYTNNTGGTFSTLFNTMTGLTITGNLTVTGGTSSLFSGNSSSDLVRITQIGTGNAFVVEDSTNPDTSPFVINNIGNVGIGTTTPISYLDINLNSSLLDGETLPHGIRIGLADGGFQNLLIGADASNNISYLQSLAYADYIDGQLSLNPRGGKVGIGIYNNLNAQLHIQNTTTENSFLVEDSTNPDSSPFVINNAGNVGVGVGTPTTKLDVSGDTKISGGLTATTVSATTYLNLPTDIRVTGGTYSDSTGVATFTNNTGGTFNVNGFFKPTDDIYTTGMTFNNGTYDLSIGRNDGTSFSQSLAILASDMTVTGGTYNGSTGVATFTNNSGGTFNVSGFLTGMTDTYTTGVTFNNNILTIQRNAGQPDINTLINNFSGLTVNGTISATTISATTYQNLPPDLWTQSGTSIYYNTGNVGIGESNPTRKFEVLDGTSRTYFNLTGTSGPAVVVTTTDFTKLTRFIASDGTSSINVGMRTSGETANPGFGGQNDAFIYVNTSANGLNIINAQSTGNGDYIRLYAGITANQGTSHLHVQGSGSTKGFIGVNTENPTERLHVSGNTLISGNLSATTISATTYLNLPPDLWTQNGTSIYYNTGKVGIGITNPTREFEVVANTETFYTDLTNVDGVAASISSTDLSKRVRFGAINSGSSVSIGQIGTTATGSTGYGSQGDSYLFSSTAANNLNIITQSGIGTEDNIKFFAGNTATATPSMIIVGSGTTKGFVGIGTASPTNTLQIHGNPTASIRLQETGSGGNKRLDLSIDASAVARISANQSAQSIAFDTVNSERIRITSAGNVGIGTTVPSEKLHVSGNTLISGNLLATTISATTYLNLPTDIRVTGGTHSSGTTTFTNNTGGTFTVSGFSTGNTTLYLYAESSTIPSVRPIVNGTNSIALGGDAQALASDMFVYGQYAGNGTTGATYSNFIGYYAGYQSSGSSQSNFIGFETGRQSSGNTTSNFFGYRAGYQAINSPNGLFMGSTAGYLASGSSQSNFIGNNAGRETSNSIQSNFIGTSAGYGANSSQYSNFTGHLAGAFATGSSYSNFIGYYAGYQANDSTTSNFIGWVAGQGANNFTNSNFIGNAAGYLTSGSSQSNFIGFESGRQSSGNTTSNFFGYRAGYQAINNPSGLFMGSTAGLGATGATSSNFIGNQAGYQSNASIYSNMLGFQAGYQASTASYSNFIGFQAGRDTTGVTYSNLFGYYAGESFAGNNIGSNNIIIGTNISLPNATTNSINIGGVLFGTNTYSTTTGNPSITPTSTGRIGIGIVTPSERLHVSGNTLITGNLNVSGNTNVRGLTGTSATISGTGQNILTVIGSGNSTSSPLFSVQGSSGELFSVTDSLTGSLFSVNDISGLPIVEVFSDNTMLVGSYQAPALNTTVKTILTAGTNTIYSIPTSAYTGSFIDYTVISSGATGARAGTIMSIWSGTTAQYTDVSTNDIGTTAGITFSVSVVGNNAVLSSSATTAGWTLKTIIRSI